MSETGRPLTAAETALIREIARNELDLSPVMEGIRRLDGRITGLTNAMHKVELSGRDLNAEVKANTERSKENKAAINKIQDARLEAAKKAAEDRVKETEKQAEERVKETEKQADQQIESKTAQATISAKQAILWGVLLIVGSSVMGGLVARWLASG